MNIINNYTSVEQVAGQLSSNNASKVSGNSTENVSFQDILNQKKSIAEVLNEKQSIDTSTLKFSKHAGERLADRDIVLTDEQMQRLEDGAQKASSKGIKESLVLVDNIAFIVNTKSNTVVTAMDQNTNQDNIYTNIDGAVVI